MITLGVLVVIGLALLGAPLFAVVLGAAMLGFYSNEIDLAVVAIELYRLTDTPLLVALPLFTFSGYLLSESNTSKRLVDMMQALVGWMPSGLALVGFAACAVFTALTGYYYDATGNLGLLLVPSVPLILYGIVAQQLDVGEPFTIQDLFIAGVLPALLMIVLLTLYSLWLHRGGVIPRIPFSWPKLRSSMWAARWELPLPVVVLGGIYGGLFAVSEAAAMTALYVLFAEVVLYKEIPLKKLPSVMVDSMVMVGGILLILGVALAFTNYLVDAEIPQRLFAFTQQHIKSTITFLILLNILLLVLGAVLDIFSALVIMVPLILPLAVGYGVHPVHLGIIFLANMQIGYFTPPIGMNLSLIPVYCKLSVQETDIGALLGSIPVHAGIIDCVDDYYLCACSIAGTA